MGKSAYILFFAALANWAVGQTNIGLNNMSLGNDNSNMNVSNTNNPKTFGSNIAQTNFQQQLPGNAGFADNNIGIPQQAVQQASVNHDKSTVNDGPVAFKMSKPSSGSGSASRSAGRHHAMTFSKRMKKLNRKMAFVLSKKSKRSFAVDYCFAWK